MEPSQLNSLADLLRDHRERLAAVADALAERGEPISDLEAQLLVEAGTMRLSDVEDALRAEAALRSRRRLWRIPLLRGLAWRAYLLRSPRIGILRHHSPRPLVVPVGYLRARPPDPAPTISIVTPSYQQGRFIERTVYSVVSQHYPALEYVVQDGGSSDETPDVLERFASVLTSWRSEPDSGQAEAINRGFSQTSGEIMGWLNSDDLLLPGALAYVARYFAEHPDVDVVYGNRVMIDESDGAIGIWVLPSHDDAALTLSDFVPQETLFWRRRIWEAVGASVDTSFRYAVDWDLLLRFRDAGARFAHVPRFIGAFRVHAEQKTTVDEEVGLVECDALRRRVHGRPMTIPEVLEALQPYFRRHVRAHTWQRLIDRLPIRRIAVPTAPAHPPPSTPPGLPPAGGVQEPAVVSPLVPRGDVATSLVRRD